AFHFPYNDTATTEIYTLSLHDALPIYGEGDGRFRQLHHGILNRMGLVAQGIAGKGFFEFGYRANVASVQFRNERQVLALRNRERSEEHTSELQSQSNLVCRLLLEKKKK